MDILETATQIFQTEIDALIKTRDALNDNFKDACKEICACTGKIVISGVGKSGIIARKIVATFSSLGIPSVFLDPLDALHGDLGLLTTNDLLILISNSGASPELEKIAEYAYRNLGTLVISITSNTESKLSKLSSTVLLISYDKEACYLNLAPTASTTATLALGDALALTVAQMRDFDEQSFSKIHPAGSLGKQLQQVSDIMITENLPLLTTMSTIKDYVFKVSKLKLGAAVILFPSEIIVGIFTDGDLRRYLIGHSDLNSDLIKYVNAHFVSISPWQRVSEARQLMEEKKITFLPVVVDNKLQGIITLGMVL